MTEQPIIEVIHGEALTVMRGMPAESFDTIIADPPYSSGGTTSAARQADPVSKYVQSTTKRQDVSFEGDARDQRSWTFWMTLWLLEAYRLAKTSGRLYVFTDWRQLPSTTDAVQAAGWVWRGVIPWDKGRGSRAPHTGYHRHQAEYVVWATKGPVPRADGRGPFEGLIRARVPAPKLHPTQKDVEGVMHLVRATPPGGRILDPFAGSGTTLVAAALAGYDATGIELSGYYVGVIRERLAREVASCAIVR